MGRGGPGWLALVLRRLAASGLLREAAVVVGPLVREATAATAQSSRGRYTSPKKLEDEPWGPGICRGAAPLKRAVSSSALHIRNDENHLSAALVEMCARCS